MSEVKFIFEVLVLIFCIMALSVGGDNELEVIAFEVEVLVCNGLFVGEEGGLCV